LLYGHAAGYRRPVIAREVAAATTRRRHPVTCAWRPDVTEFPAGFGHNCGAQSVTRWRMKMEGVQDPDGH
jgi:hypothetical protein